MTGTGQGFRDRRREVNECCCHVTTTGRNKGISACAVCDGAAPIFRKKPIAVIGGGDSAMEEANFLTKYGSKVYLIVRYVFT